MAYVNIADNAANIKSLLRTTKGRPLNVNPLCIFAAKRLLEMPSTLRLGAKTSSIAEDNALRGRFGVS